MEILKEYTIVEECYDIDTLGNRIRFGNVFKSKNTTLGSINIIKNQEIVVMQRWVGNEYGTQNWCLYIFRGNGTTNVPGVYPKVNLLLFCSGSSRVNRVLALIKKINGNGINISNIEDSYYIYQNSRVNTGKVLTMPSIKE